MDDFLWLFFEIFKFSWWFSDLERQYLVKKTTILYPTSTLHHLVKLSFYMKLWVLGLNAFKFYGNLFSCRNVSTLKKTKEKTHNQTLSVNCCCCYEQLLAQQPRTYQDRYHQMTHCQFFYQADTYSQLVTPYLNVKTCRRPKKSLRKLSECLRWWRPKLSNLSWRCFDSS